MYKHIVQFTSQKPDLCSAMSLVCVDIYINMLSFDYKIHTASRVLRGVVLVIDCLSMQGAV